MIRLVPTIGVLLVVVSVAGAQQPRPGRGRGFAPASPTAPPPPNVAPGNPPPGQQPVAVTPHTRPAPPPIVPAPSRSTINLRTEQTLAPQVLEALDREALGQLYTPDIAAKLPALHQLIEKYFDSAGKELQAVLPRIKALNLDPTIVGRVMHIRLRWPSIQGGTYYVTDRIGAHRVQYFFGVPQGYDPAKPWPLVIKLQKEATFDNRAPDGTESKPPFTADQVAWYYTGWLKQELEAHPDAIVLMPMVDLREGWGPTQQGMNNVVQPMLHLADFMNIDPARVYLYGYAASAHRGWNLALHYPTYFASIGSLSAGVVVKWQHLRLPNLRNIFIAAWADPADKDLPIEPMRKMVQELRQKKYGIDYEESAPSADVLTRIYDKMRGHARELYPRQVELASNRPESVFNRNDWIQVFQLMAPGSDEKPRFLGGLPIVRGLSNVEKLQGSGSTGELVLYKNPYDLVATFTAPNRVEVVCHNVQSLRVLLNDQLVDLSQPVTLILNGRQRFQGIVKPTLEELFADQVALGRGWRYFTAHVDFDFDDVDYSARPTTRRGRIDYTPIAN